MDEKENRFFEAYKSADRLCSDCYRTTEGISTYIAEMEKQYSGRYMVKNWDEEYKELKRCRWIRNKIAHSNESNDLNDYDIEYIKNFHNRIIAGEDPLTVIRKRTEERKSVAPTVKTPRAEIPQTLPNGKKRKTKRVLPTVVFAAIAITIILLIIIFGGLL